MTWVTLCRRTNDPKLKDIERRLDEMWVPHRRSGESFHAPILQVPSELYDLAETILTLEYDEIPDDDPRFLGIKCPNRALNPCGGCGESNPDKRCLGCLHPF